MLYYEAKSLYILAEKVTKINGLALATGRGNSGNGLEGVKINYLFITISGTAARTILAAHSCLTKPDRIAS